LLLKDEERKGKKLSDQETRQLHNMEREKARITAPPSEE